MGHEDPWGALDTILGLPQTAGLSLQSDDVKQTQAFADVNHSTASQGPEYRSTTASNPPTMDPNNFYDDEMEASHEDEDYAPSPKPLSLERSSPHNELHMHLLSSYHQPDHSQGLLSFEGLRSTWSSATKSSAFGLAFLDDSKDDVCHTLDEVPNEAPVPLLLSNPIINNLSATTNDFHSIKADKEPASTGFQLLNDPSNIVPPACVSTDTNVMLCQASAGHGNDADSADLPQPEDCRANLISPSTVLNAISDRNDGLSPFFEEAQCLPAAVCLPNDALAEPLLVNRDQVLDEPSATADVQSYYPQVPPILDDVNQPAANGVSVEQTRNEDGLYLGPQLFVDSDYEEDD